MSGSLHQLAGILEALTGFRHVFSPDGLNTTLLSQGYKLENSLHSGNGGQSVLSKDRGGDKEPLSPAHRSTGSHVMT